jgi:hypothetical protein
MSDTARSYQTNQPADNHGWDDFFAAESGHVLSSPGSQPGLDNSCPDSWMTLTEAAASFSVNEKTLRRWIKQGRVNALKISGPRGPEWRVEPGHPHAQVSQFVSGLDMPCPGMSSPLSQFEDLSIYPRFQSEQASDSQSCLEPGLDTVSPDISLACSQIADVSHQSETEAILELDEPTQNIISNLPHSLSSLSEELVEMKTRLSIFENENRELKAQLQGATYRNGFLEAKLEDKENQILLLTDSQSKQGWWARFSSWFFRSR